MGEEPPGQNNMVPAKGTWLTPLQLSEGLMYQWQKYENIKIDSEVFPLLSTKIFFPFSLS